MRHSEDGTAHQAGVATYFGRMGSPTKTKSLNYDLRLFSRETRHRITMDMPQFVDGARKDRKLSPFQPDLTFWPTRKPRTRQNYVGGPEGRRIAVAKRNAAPREAGQGGGENG